MLQQTLMEVICSALLVAGCAINPIVIQRGEYVHGHYLVNVQLDSNTIETSCLNPHAWACTWIVIPPETNIPEVWQQFHSDLNTLEIRGMIHESCHGISGVIRFYVRRTPPEQLSPAAKAFLEHWEDLAWPCHNEDHGELSQ